MQSTRPFEVQDLDEGDGGDAVEAAYTRYTGALQRAGAAQDAVAEVGRALADSPQRSRTLRAPLQHALDALDDALAALGEATMGWVALGGTVDLIEPAAGSGETTAPAGVPVADEAPHPVPAVREVLAPPHAEPVSLPAVVGPVVGPPPAVVQPPVRPVSPPATPAQLDRLVSGGLGCGGPAPVGSGDRRPLRGDRTTAPARGPNPEVALEALAAAITRRASVAEIEGVVRLCLRAGVSPADPRLIGRLADLGQPLTGKDLKAVRKALRAARARPFLEVVAEDAPVPADWPFWSKTRGRRVVIVGGDKRDAACDRLKAAFDMGEVQWDDAHARRRIDALAARIRRGSVDLVILVTGYLSHSVSDALVAACKDAGAPFVNVPRGYGVAGVRKAIEEASAFRPTP